MALLSKLDVTMKCKLSQTCSNPCSCVHNSVSQCGSFFFKVSQLRSVRVSKRYLLYQQIKGAASLHQIQLHSTKNYLNTLTYSTPLHQIQIEDHQIGGGGQREKFGRPTKMTTRLEVPLEINFLHSPSKYGDYSPFSSSTGVALKIRSENICTQNLLLPGTQNSGVFVSLPSRGINGTDISRPTDRSREVG